MLTKHLVQLVESVGDDVGRSHVAYVLCFLAGYKSNHAV